MKSFVLGTLAVLLCLGVAGLPARAEDKPAPPKKPGRPSMEDIAKQIAEAMPDKPVVQPAKPRKLLVFSLCKGYRHGSIPIANEMLKVMAQKTGAFEATFNDDPAVFTPEKLKDFDGVFMNNNTAEFFGPTPKPNTEPTEENKAAAARVKALVDFVSSGKGVAGMHAATDWKGWDDYGTLMGGQFLSHPYSKVVLRNDEPAHPINAAFEGKEFAITDEMYTFKPSATRKDKRVLLSIDPEKSNITKQVREDKDYWVSWVKPVGKGRVFYCSLGHQTPIFYNKQVLQHYLAGIQYALGDLKADDAPKGEVAPPAGGAPEKK